VSYLKDAGDLDFFVRAGLSFGASVELAELAKGFTNTAITQGELLYIFHAIFTLLGLAANIHYLLSPFPSRRVSRDASNSAVQYICAQFFSVTDGCIRANKA
jgi:hypothetical protein